MRASILPYYTDCGPMGRGQYNGQGVYCGLSIASEVFLIFTTQLYQKSSVFFPYALFTDEPEVFLPKYPQTAILHAAHFRRVVNGTTNTNLSALSFTSGLLLQVHIFTKEESIMIPSLLCFIKKPNSLV